jgi:hypothetical protein
MLYDYTTVKALFEIGIRLTYSCGKRWSEQKYGYGIFHTAVLVSQQYIVPNVVFTLFFIHL